MKYEPQIEIIAIMDTPHTSISRRKSLADDCQIRRTRETLLIMPIVCLILSMITSIFLLILFHVMVGTENLQPFLQIGQALISVLLHGFGFFVIYRSSALGLRVFAWLYAIMIIFESIGVFLAILFSITNPGFSYFLSVQTDSSIINVFVIFFIIFCICFTGVFILSVTIFKLALKFARLLDFKESLINIDHKHFIC